MPLKTLVVIALRLYAIYWLVDSLSTMLVSLPMLLAFMSKVSPDLETQGLWSSILIPLVLLAFAVVLWLLSSRLSSLVIDGHDMQLTFGALTKEDLYRFAFVFLGLFFVLSSIFSVFESGYQFFTLDLPQPDDNPHKGYYLWPFLGHAFTLIAGFTCVFGSKKWTKKLIRIESKNDASPPTVTS